MVFIPLLFFLFFNFISGQEKERVEKISEEISQLEKSIQEEQDFFKKFLEQQNRIIREKEIEKRVVKNEIKKKINEIKEINNEIFKLETKIQEINSFNALIKDYFLEFGQELKNKIINGIPFEREKREAIISSLITDLAHDQVSINEAFSRFNNFLDSEVALGYDSQNIKVIEKINGVDQEFELLRMGRIFFILIDGDNVVLWEKEDQGKYHLNTSQQLSINQIRTIKNVSGMLQGRKAPEISKLPIKLKSYLKKQQN